MSALRDLLTVAAAIASALFFTAGTLGLLRFPDLRTRLHALAKADSLGLGFAALAVIPQAGSFGASAKVLLIWVFAAVSAALSAHLLASPDPTERTASARRTGAAASGGPDDDGAGPAETTGASS